MIRRPIIYAASAASFFLVAALYIVLRIAVPIGEIKEPYELRVEEGMNFRQAVELFSSKGLIRDKQVFIALGRMTGLDKKLMPGYYYINGNPSPLDIFMDLKKARVIRWEVIVVEGDTLEDIGGKLARKGIIKEDFFKKLSTDGKFLEDYGIDGPSLEGYLFPDTYRIPKGMKPEDVLGMMIDRLREQIGTELYYRMAETNMEEKSVLTLASIIEKEAAVEGERPIISAVYHNRLKKGMRLQADPTAIYGLKQQRKGITKSDIRKRTQYNTYYINGLPPGPIASPGIRSIRAALNPANVQYLYFVSTGEGSHTFSLNAEDHREAVAAYFAKKAEIKAMRTETTEETETTKTK